MFFNYISAATTTPFFNLKLETFNFNLKLARNGRSAKSRQVGISSA